MQNYDYYMSWSDYAYEEESKRFLSDSEAVKYLCETIPYTGMDEKAPRDYVESEGGGIPLVKNDQYVYAINNGHTLCSGTSGNKKTRCVVKPAIIASALKSESMVINDIKGEIAADGMIMNFLKDKGYEIYQLDFRTMDKDGFNFFDYPLRLIKVGKKNKAGMYLSQFAYGLTATKKTNDDFWIDSARSLIESLSYLLLLILAHKKDGKKYANISSIVNLLNGEKDVMQSIFTNISNSFEKELYNPGSILLNIYMNPEKTLSCILTSAFAVMNEWVSNVDLAKMLSTSSFNPTEMYEKKMAVILVIPDETDTYNRVAGMIIDSIYSQLLEAYALKYQSTDKAPAHAVNFLLDEFCNIRVNDISSKISAARSRKIFFQLIYQSDKQLEEAYENEVGTIKGNCINKLFLGSTDYEVLKEISDSIGDRRSKDGKNLRPLVSIEDLRKMQKTREYKDALLIKDNYLYCARLADYEQYSILAPYRGKQYMHNNMIQKNDARAYSPGEMVMDVVNLGWGVKLL